MMNTKKIDEIFKNVKQIEDNLMANQ